MPDFARLCCPMHYKWPPEESTCKVYATNGDEYDH